MRPAGSRGVIVRRVAGKSTTPTTGSSAASALNNLAIFCLRGHRLKHQTAWKVKQRKNGTLEWTSPAGRVTATHPATRTKPVLPEGYDLPVRAEGVPSEGVGSSGGPRLSMDELWDMADRSTGNDAPF